VSINWDDDYLLRNKGYKMTRDKILESVAKLKSGKTFIVGCYDKRDRRIERRISWWLAKL
jgi:hypothetical protein